MNERTLSALYSTILLSEVYAGSFWGYRNAPYVPYTAFCLINLQVFFLVDFSGMGGLGMG